MEPSGELDLTWNGEDPLERHRGHRRRRADSAAEVGRGVRRRLKKDGSTDEAPSRTQSSRTA
jgi:hypothetical protein